MLLIGVAIFSYVMGIFIEVIEKTKACAADLEDLELLGKFTGVMKHFNRGREMNDELKV